MAVLLPAMMLSFNAIQYSPLCSRSSSIHRKWGPCRAMAASAGIEMWDPRDVEIGRMLGTYGFMNVTSYSPPPQLEYGLPVIVERLGKQEVNEGSVKIRLYSGRVSRGPRAGTRVILKVYPGRTVGGMNADAMAANELASYAVLQDISEGERCANLTVLLGAFQTQTGEQWLVFRDDGQITAADYAKVASEATSNRKAVGEWEFWDYFDVGRPIVRRRIFILKLLRGVFTGLAYMHSKGILHQSLGPASVVLNTTVERETFFLQSHLRDLAFAVDVSDGAIFQSQNFGTLLQRRNVGDLPMESAFSFLSEGLWRRASSAGATTPLERKAFGISDDIYAAGLLFLYMVFIPFCKEGSLDGPSLQRLFESTFRLDLQAARDYCLADERWIEAVKFLDLGDGSGWELLQAMLNPDYRQRPIAEAILNHRFMTGAVL